MRKILLTLFLFISFFSFSQNVGHAYKVVLGPWDESTQGFILHQQKVDMRIFFEKTIIRVEDYVNSTYMTSNGRIEEDDDTYKIVSWDAIDEKSRKCKIFLGFYVKTREKSLAIIYPNYIFQYYYYD